MCGGVWGCVRVCVGARIHCISLSMNIISLYNVNINVNSNPRSDVTILNIDVDFISLRYYRDIYKRDFYKLMPV